MDISKVRIAPSTLPTDILSALRRAQTLGPESLYDTLHQWWISNAEHVGLAHAPTSLISLADICERINRSKSWVYANIIAGDSEKQAKKKPPHQFDWLPPRVIPGKALWIESEFESWLQQVIARARQATSQAATSGKTRREVMP